MKRIIMSGILSIVFFGIAFSQMDRRIGPASSRFSKSLFTRPPELLIPPLSDKEITQLDYNASKNGALPKFARNIPINVNIVNSGMWTALPNGGRVWRIELTAKGALGLLPLFDTLYIPAGALLHIYMPDNEETLGAYTHANTPAPRAFCGGLIHGESCIIEYYEPASQKGKGILSINKIGYAYRWVSPLYRSGSSSCEVNPSCPQGDGWQDQVRSSVRIYIVNNVGEGYCSGALINNVRNDCTPYILSAEHCTEDSVTDYELLQWVFLFNYQTANCSDINCTSYDMINGCTKVASSNDDDGERGSDFILLKLNSSPPDSFNVFFSGWNNTDNASDSGVCIHHPEGDCTKISTYNSTVQSSTWGDTAMDTHWEVVWSSGVTEPGSSGSPLYNPDKLIVGHLTGGNSCCVASACGPESGPTSPDFFGKIWFDWNLDGVTPSVQLQPWLDPDNTGASILQGMNPPCGGVLQNDAGIETVIEPNGNICSPTFTPSLVLRNWGSNKLTSCSILYLVDNNGAPTSYGWSGNLIPGGSTMVTLPTMSASPGSHTFTASVKLPNGSSNTNPDNLAVANFYISPVSAQLILYLTTDNNGSQITWQITDSGSNVVASGGPYADYRGGESFQIPICLQPGCYTFTLYSATGTGMTNGEDGNFQITGPNGTPVYASLSNPDFGSAYSSNLCITTAINEISAPYLSVIPNPSTGLFNIGFNNGEQKTIRVYDVLGRIVLEKQSYDKNIIIDLSSVGKGVYILETDAIDGKNNRKLVVD